MSDKVITIPQFSKQSEQISGFTQSQFRRLDGIYLKASAEKALTYRTVECDFEEGLASYTYYVSTGQSPFIQFLIRRVGPRTVMYEIYLKDKGRILKSGLFDRAYERLEQEVQSLIDKS